MRGPAVRSAGVGRGSRTPKLQHGYSAAAGSAVRGRLLRREFFETRPELVAPRLLGKLLVHQTDSGQMGGRIVEAEAYLGPHNDPPDPAAHSHRGPTPRNVVLFGHACSAARAGARGRTGADGWKPRHAAGSRADGQLPSPAHLGAEPAVPGAGGGQVEPQWTRCHGRPLAPADLGRRI